MESKGQKTILNYSDKRIIDYDSKKCYVRDDVVTLFSPFDFMEGNNLYLPEGVRMPDGRIIDSIRHQFDSAIRKDWNGEPISLYAGHNYLYPVENYKKGMITEKEMKDSLYYPYLSNVFLYDDEICGCTSRNGILYYKDIVYYVPERNEYAENAPLQPLKENYEEEYGSFPLCAEQCSKDLLGGIYSRDGKKFLRWSGSWNLTSYKIREGVEEIGDSAFWVETGIGNGDHGLYYLTDLLLPKGLKKIGKEAFRACPFKQINIPESVVEIGDYAFASCLSLRTITLPKNLKSLGESVFWCCSIEYITIPQSVVHIGKDCFRNCYELKEIEVEDLNINYSSDEGILFNKNKSVLISVPSKLRPNTHEDDTLGEETAIIRTEEVKSPEDGIVVFQDLVEGITYVNKTDKETGKTYKETIHTNGTYLSPMIGVNSPNCMLREGEKIYVEDKEVIKAGTVYLTYEYYDNSNWNSLNDTRREYTIPGSVSIILNSAFVDSSLKDIYLPESIISIEDNAFNGQRIKISPENKHYKVDNNLLIDIDKRKTIYSLPAEKCVVPPGIEVIGRETFRSAKCKSIIIPEGVTAIMDYAFLFCFDVEYIKLPSTICYISPNSFNGCVDVYSEKEMVIEVPYGLKDKYLNMISDDIRWTVNRIIKEEKGKTDSKNSSDLSYKDLLSVTEEDLFNAVTDEFGALYSNDGKRLLKFPTWPESETECDWGFDTYYVKDGTEVICDNAHNSVFTTLYIPESMKYIGNYSIHRNTPIVVFLGNNIKYIDESLDPNEYSLYYIPCGTWLDFRSRLEAILAEETKDDDNNSYEEEKCYRLMELSKASVILNLEQQRDSIVKSILQTNVFEEYSIDKLNGDKRQGIYGYRTANKIFYFDSKCDYSHILDQFYIPVLHILGITHDKLLELLDVEIDEIENNINSLQSVVGKELAENIRHFWNEDFVDEDTGDVVTIERAMVIMDAGITIQEEHIEDIIKDKSKEKVMVFRNYYNPNYAEILRFYSKDDDFIRGYSEEHSEELQKLFPNKKLEDITETEKESLAYNIVMILKKTIEHPGYLNKTMIPLREDFGDIHDAVSVEETNLATLISEFYNKKICEVRNCQNEKDVMRLYKNPLYLQCELKEILKSNGLLQVYLNIGIDMLFEYYLDDQVKLNY